MPYLPCSSCGVVRHTRPDALLCVKCITKKRRDEFAIELDSKGYTVHSDLSTIPNNKAKVEVTNRECNHRYQVQLCNLLSGASKCSVCGPKKRGAQITAFSKEYFARNYDLTLWEDYLTQVRQLSNRCYDANIDVLNPKRLPRSRPDLNPDAVNLDHIVPIIECFKRGWDIHEAAALTNLQLLPAHKNLSKKQTLDAEFLDLSDRPAMEWINDGTINRFVRIENVKTWVANGWEVGQLKSRIGKHLVGKVWVTDGTVNKRHDKDLPVEPGWTFGRTMLNTAAANAKRTATWAAKRSI
jgi:hypothetical protein